MFLCLSFQKSFDSELSLRKYAVTLSCLLAKSVSKQAIWKKITPLTTSFFVAILQAIVGKEVKAHKSLTKELLSFFPRILIQDSTIIPLNKSLFKHFPGSSSQNGANSSMRIQVVYNLLNSAFVFFDISSYRVNDHKAAHDLSFLREGDLLIRDLGYFSASVFKRISDLKAFFLSRLVYRVTVLDPETKKPINLLKFLKKKTFVDVNVLLSKSDMFPVRLVGQKLPADVADKRRRDCLNDRNKRLNPSKEHLELLSWGLYVTNIGQERWSIETLILLYSLRWRIEIIFKSWKSCLTFKLKKCKMSPDQVNLLIYSRLIIATILTSEYYPHFEAKVYSKSKRHLSLIKFLDVFMSDTEMFITLIESKVPEEQYLLINILIKHATYERRKRLNYPEKIMLLCNILPKHDKAM